MVLDSSTLLTISSYMEIAFIALFALIAIGAGIAALVGFKKGIFKSTYKLLGYALFFTLALLTVKPLMDLIFNFNLSGFGIDPLSFNLTLGSKQITVSANVTTVEGTLTDLVNSFCSGINASKYVTDITAFVKTIVVSILSFAVYFLDLILIVTLGKLFLEILWLIFFKRSAPKITRKLSKLRVVGLFENVVTYLVLVFLFISPLTSLVNSINQGVQKSNIRNSQNETVQEVVKLVDIYNDSLFARTLFNWNTDLESNTSGLTFDSAILDYFAKTANGGVDGLSLSSELTKLATAAGNFAGFLNNDGTNSMSLASDAIGSILSAASSSQFLSGIIEIGIGLALESDLLEELLPNGKYLGDFTLEEGMTFEGEMAVFKNMATDIIDSGIIEDFIDLNTFEIKPMTDLVTYFDDLFTLESNRSKVDKLLNVFNRLDEFKLLNNALGTMLCWGVTMDSSYSVLKIIGGNVELDNPYDDEDNMTLLKNFFSNIEIGNEIHTIFDALWGLASCGEHMIKNVYNAFASEDETVKQEAKDALVDTLTDHSTMVKFRDCIAGTEHMKSDGTAEEVDANEGEHYALMDSGIITKLFNETDFAKNIFNLVDMSSLLGDSLEDSKTRWNTLMTNVYSDTTLKPIGFFKNEINSILTVVTDIAELKTETASSEPSSAHKSCVIKLNEGEEPSTEEEETENTTFVYKEYESLLEAAINLFDGWINSDDVVGSILSLDSQIAPYLSKAFKCLISLDNSEIVKAIGIPLVAGKIESMEESLGNYFDVTLVADTIKSDGHVFQKISNFFNTSMVNTLQHFYVGFLMNDDGVFDIEALTNLISTDIGGFLDKLNEQIVEVKDDPLTPENETVIDTHPLKYYLAEFLKGFYNFELFNPQTGENANKNMKQLLNFVFGYMEAFGVEKPTDATYAGLDGETAAETKANWENELTAMSNLLACIGENRMLAFGDYSSSISGALLYSLANNTAKAEELDPDNASKMPKNLGGVLNAVGDSYLFSTMMGGLLDTYLDGTICDTSISVQFANITTGAEWKQEGETMNALLNTIAQLDLDLNNLDFTSINDYVGLNEMLHNLAASQIFKSSEGNKFGEWLFSKVETAMDSMSGGLLNDPTGSDWDSSWDSVDGLGTEGTTRIARYDFLYRNGYAPSDYENNKAGWYSTTFDTNISQYKTSINYDSLTKSQISSYFETDANLDTYYNSVLQYDEIGRLVNVLARGCQLMSGGSGIDFTTLSEDDLGNLLNAINNTDCLRIASYNAMNLAKTSIGSNNFVHIEKATFSYLITTGESLTDYNAARSNRAEEIQHIVNFYGYYKDLQDITGCSLDASAFFDKTKLCQILGIDSNGNSNGTDILSNMLAELHNTQCFNLQVSNNPTRDPSTLSFFEDMMANLMEQSGLLDLTEATSDVMKARVVSISNLEMDGTDNPNGYNNAWVEYDSDETLVGGEILSLMGVLKSVVAVTEGSTIDANSISITSIQAAKVTNIMKSVNGSYLCTGVMKHFVTSAFTGGLGLESLLKYDAADENMVANFDLTHTEYGGADNSCGEGTEIYNFYSVLNAMQYEDGSGNLQFVSLGDLATAINSKSDCFDGIFYFLYNSKILGAEYNANIKGRSVMLYNALSSFDSYLIGTDKADKMASIEKIFTTTSAIDDDYYKIEANGITRIIDAAGNSISGVTVDSLRNDPTLKTMILNVVRYTYDRDDGKAGFTTDTDITKARAYFASEIVSGIFDDVLDSEYQTIASNFDSATISAFADYNVFYFASKATGGRATTANDITATVFDNINEVEVNGLDGMISMTTYINGDADRSGSSISSIATNPFVIALTTNASTIRSLFANKLHSNGQDSRIAKVLYISRGAKTVVNETTNDGGGYPTSAGLLVLAKYATNYLASLSNGVSYYTWKASDGFTTDYYGASFSFDTYGNDLMNYVESCTTAA